MLPSSSSCSSPGRRNDRTGRQTPVAFDENEVADAVAGGVDDAVTGVVVDRGISAAPLPSWLSVHVWGDGRCSVVVTVIICDSASTCFLFFLFLCQVRLETER
jgi:hypothetical protein